MSAATIAAPAYLMGHTTTETERLIRQSRFLNPATRHLLTEAGITAGMRVLDLGSGGGDVALMAADVVGPTGQVLGVDRAPTRAGVDVGRRAADGAAPGRVTAR